MSKTGFFLDFRIFNKNFKNFTNKIAPEALKDGTFKAATELLRDAIVLPPQAPKDIGDLWASRQVEQVKITPKEISIQCGFNTVYATKWHELPLSRAKTIKWTTWKGASRPGPKYLESKMIKYKDKYMKMIADVLSQRM